MPYLYEAIAAGVVIIAIIILVMTLKFKKRKQVRREEEKQQAEAELKASVFKKATQNWNETTELSKEEGVVIEQSFKPAKDLGLAKKQNIRLVLLEVAERGATGVLLNSISDKTGVNRQDTASALSYLTQQSFVEEINSPSGNKYYLTEVGRKYCISKEFNSGDALA